MALPRGTVGLEEQLGSVRIFGRNHGEPARVAERDIPLLHEPEPLRVEIERLLLIVDQHARHGDSHTASSSLLMGQRSTMRCSGAGSKKWSLYLPSRLLVTSPADSSTSRCCEIACRVELTP